MLRIGILLNSEKVPVWVAEIIKEISAHPQIQWTLAVLNAALESSVPPSAFFKWFRNVDRMLLPSYPDLLANVNLDLPAGLPVVKVHPINQGSRNYFTVTDLKAIEGYKPDLLLCFGFEILTGDILNLTRFGVWTLSHGDLKRFRGGPPGFWEWFHHFPVTGVTVQRLKEEPLESECLAFAETKTQYLTFNRNQSSIFSKGIDLMVNTVIKLANSEEYITVPLQFHYGPIYPDPGFYNSVCAVGKLLFRLTSKLISRFFYVEQWVLFFRLTPQNSPALDFEKFKGLIPPKDRIWADPFVITQNGKYYIFIEEFLTKTNRGHITCMVLNQHGEVDSSAIILKTPFHLSYPFIFKHMNIWYMIPESAENKTVDLYECKEFPFQWKHKRTLLSGIQAFDSTIHFHEGRIWLFCTIQKPMGSSSDDDLYVFSTNDLLEGEWYPHPENPVVSDPFKARPAGRIFMHEGVWYRPSQICVPRYGYGLSFNRIVELNLSHFKEEHVSEVFPHWRKNLLTTHTFNFENDITIIDGQIKRFKFYK